MLSPEGTRNLPLLQFHSSSDIEPFQKPHRGDDFIIHVTISNYTESTAHGEFLSRHHGRPLHFDANAKLRPAVEHLEWHRRYHRIAS